VSGLEVFIIFNCEYVSESEYHSVNRCSLVARRNFFLNLLYASDSLDICSSISNC